MEWAIIARGEYEPARTNHSGSIRSFGLDVTTISLCSSAKSTTMAVIRARHKHPAAECEVIWDALAAGSEAPAKCVDEHHAALVVHIAPSLPMSKLPLAATGNDDAWCRQ